jgi:hypothetical protein
VPRVAALAWGVMYGSRARRDSNPTRGLEVGQRPSIELPLVTLEQLMFGVASA